MSKPCELWGVLWRSRNKRDGVTEHIIFDNCIPLMYRTRQQARDTIKQRWGHLLDRGDLRAEPHGWRMPVPVRILVTVKRRA